MTPLIYYRVITKKITGTYSIKQDNFRFDYKTSILSKRKIQIS